MGYDKQQRPTAAQKGERLMGVVVSTAASTSLDPRGVTSLVTTSTGAPVVYALSGIGPIGQTFELHATTVASSSVAPFHINMPSGVGVGSSSEDMLTLAIPGDGATLRVVSTSRVAVVGSHGAVFSSST